MHIDRLMILRDHMERSDRFYFGRYTDSNDCGTLHCAAGECPIIWRNHWKFDEWKYPILKNDTEITAWHALMQFFDLSYDEVGHLFMPSHQRARWGKKLYSNCTLSQWLSNFDNFINLKLDGKI